jgi:hypothetical protein
LAGAGDGFLYPGRRILGDLDTGAREQEQHDAARVTELGGRLSVLVKKQIFDGADARAMLLDYRAQLDFDTRESISDGGLAVQVNDAVRDVTQAVAFTGNHTPTEVKRTGIDAESEH